MSLFKESALSGLGLVSGLIFSMALVILWITVAGSIQEWLCEVTIDKWWGKQTPATLTQMDGEYSILMSDIHLDTWSYPDDPKCEAFMEFLAWIRGEKRIKDVYINGDIMDFPPHPLNQPPTPILRVNYRNPNDYPDQDAFPNLGALNPNFEKVLMAMGTLSDRDPAWPKLTVTYTTGNHDIGLYGLRYIRPTLTWSSFRVAWNPSILLHMPGDRHIYMEHGHMHDPFLWLYLRYALVELLQGPEATAQRRGKVGMTKNRGVRTMPMAMAMVSENQPMYFEGTGDVIAPKGEGFGAIFARLRFRQAARRIFRVVDLDEREQIRVVTMGHTHLPDRYEFPNGKLYINSGDWAGNDANQCFLLIHPNGFVTGPHQWRPGTTIEQLTSAS